MFFALMHAFVRTDFLCIYVLRVASGPRVKLAGRKSALTCLALCYFVLVFSVLLTLRLPPLEKLVWFVCFLSVSGMGCGL